MIAPSEYLLDSGDLHTYNAFMRSHSHHPDRCEQVIFMLFVIKWHSITYYSFDFIYSEQESR